MKDNRTYLEYISDCIERIEQYTAAGKEAFLTDSMLQDATLRRLQTLAESTQRLSEDLKTRLTEIDWRSISGLRNILVHNYLGKIDLDVIWEIIEHNLPALQEKIEAILQELKEKE